MGIQGEVTSSVWTHRVDMSWGHHNQKAGGSLGLELGGVLCAGDLNLGINIQRMQCRDGQGSMCRKNTTEAKPRTEPEEAPSAWNGQRETDQSSRCEMLECSGGWSPNQRGF